MEQQKTIYIVTVGEYSEYHICGVTFDIKIAENLKKLYSNDWEVANIEEYPVLVKNDNSLGDIVPIYRVTIYADGKSSCNVIMNVFDKEPFEPKYNLDTSPSFFDDTHFRFTFIAEIKAKDEQHAVEHARDVRAKLLNEYLCECNENVEAFNKAIEASKNLKINYFTSSTAIPNLDNVSFLSSIQLLKKEENKE